MFDYCVLGASLLIGTNYNDNITHCSIAATII
jgi:hypothetical protein